MEAALKAKALDAAVGPQESFLISIASVFFRAQQPQRHTEHTAVVLAYQTLEGVVVCLLRGSNQLGLIAHRLVGPGNHASHFHASLHLQ